MGATIYYDNIPSLYDRADGGVTNPNGTFTPAGLIGMNYSQGAIPGGYTPFFEEASNSPTVEAGEQWTITHNFKVDYITGQYLQRLYIRGSEQIDLFGNVSRVLSTVLKPVDRTNTMICDFVVVSEGTTWGQPPQEFAVNIVELNPVAEKMPRYSALTYYDRNLIRGAQVYDFATTQQVLNVVQSFSQSAVPLLNEQAQAEELLFKKMKGEDTFYLSGYQIEYSQYYWLPQPINPGGYIQDPFLSGAVPAYFWTDQNGNNIFAGVPSMNPNMFPNYGNNSPLASPPYGLSWLRQTDTQVLNRTWFKMTNRWLGAPLGTWDNEWYNGTGFQPYQTNINQGGINVAN